MWGEVGVALEDVKVGLGSVDGMFGMSLCDEVLETEMVENFGPSEETPSRMFCFVVETSATEEAETVFNQAFFVTALMNFEGMGSELLEGEFLGRCFVDGGWM